MNGARTFTRGVLAFGAATSLLTFVLCTLHLGRIEIMLGLALPLLCVVWASHAPGRTPSEAT